MNENNLSIVGIRLKQLRIERDLTMDMVVNDMNSKYNLGIRRGNISKWENGVNIPTLYILRYLSMYYDVSMDYLAGLTDSRVPLRHFQK